MAIASHEQSAESDARLPFWRQIRWHLIATFVLVALVPAIIVATITNDLARSQAKAQVFGQLESVADLKRDQIVSWLNDSSATLNVLLAKPVSDRLATYAQNPNPNQQATIDALLATATVTDRPDARDSVHFQSLFLYTPDGQIISASDSALVGRIVNRQPYFAPSLQDNHIEPPFYAVGTNELVMILTRRLIGPDGTLVAVLGGEVDLEVLGQIMIRRSGLGESGETYLVSLESHYLLTPSRFEGYPLTRAYHSEGIDRGLLGADGSATYLSYRDPPETVMGVYRWVPELQAALVAEINSGEALATVNRSQMISLAVMAGASLAALLLGLFVATRIAGPISKLTQIAGRIAAGDLDQRAALRQRNEIGVLASGFDSMAARLQSTLLGLEQRVGERTVELQQALDDQKQTLAHLHESIETREALEETVRAVSSPVLPVLDGVLVMPLIGVIDSHRASMLTSALLEGIEQHRARTVILDVTGVPLIDTQVAKVLLEAANAARLLGATPVIVGLRPELAQTIVGLGLDLSTLVTQADLQTGVRYAATQRIAAARTRAPDRS